MLASAWDLLHRPHKADGVGELVGLSLASDLIHLPRKAAGVL